MSTNIVIGDLTLTIEGCLDVLDTQIMDDDFIHRRVFFSNSISDKLLSEMSRMEVKIIISPFKLCLCVLDIVVLNLTYFPSYSRQIHW